MMGHVAFVYDKPPPTCVWTHIPLYPSQPDDPILIVIMNAFSFIDQEELGSIWITTIKLKLEANNETRICKDISNQNMQYEYLHSIMLT